MARKHRTASPTKLVRCQPEKVSMAALKKLFNLYGTAFILSKLPELDEQDRELAEKILGLTHISD